MRTCVLSFFFPGNAWSYTCYVMLCWYVMLFYVMLCYVMLCYVMLCYVMLCYVTLRYVTLCYVMLCYAQKLLAYTAVCLIVCLVLFFQELQSNKISLLHCATLKLNLLLLTGFCVKLSYKSPRYLSIYISFITQQSCKNSI